METITCLWTEPNIKAAQLIWMNVPLFWLFSVLCSGFHKLWKLKCQVVHINTLYNRSDVNVLTRKPKLFIFIRCSLSYWEMVSQVCNPLLINMHIWYLNICIIGGRIGRWLKYMAVSGKDDNLLHCQCCKINLVSWAVESEVETDATLGHINLIYPCNTNVI